MIPETVEILGSKCFWKCQFLSSIRFGWSSQLKYIGFEAFEGCSLFVLIPSSVVFLAHNFHPSLSRLRFSDDDRSQMFDRWQCLRQSGITTNFHRILRSDSSFHSFKDSVLDLSGYKEESVIRRSDRVLTQLRSRLIDGALTVVKAIALPLSIERWEIESEIQNLMNVRHPMIARLIGCAFRRHPRGWWIFRTMRVYAAEDSLAGVLLNPPVWWTPTMRAKAILGIALGLRFVHGFGLLHGAVKASNIFFDANHHVQIADFSPIRLENGSVEPFSGEGWSPTVDVSGFSSLLSEIVIGNHGSFPICSMDDSSLRPLFQRLSGR
jgi:serine/threonine protein kinase